MAKAILYTGRGGYDVVQVGSRDVRAPGPGEVRIDVKAAAVNVSDVLLRDPGYASTPPPWTPGWDAAGIVESVGPGVDGFRIGEEVIAIVLPFREEGGAQVAQIVVPVASVVRIPDGVTLQQASTLPMNGLTAEYALELAGLEPGQSLAVSGGAGLLAYYMIVLAKRRGLRVIADAKPSEVDLVRGYGADSVVARGDSFGDAVRAVEPNGVDALLDTAVLLEKAFPAIRNGGIYIPVRGWTGPPAERDIQIKPVFVSKVVARTDWLEELRDLVSSGAIELRVTGEYPPEQIVEAQRVITGGGVRGRPVIVF